MGELLERWPSAALTLFARFGVGTRDKLGFRADQPLSQVLARHLLFDVPLVLERLGEAEAAQQAFRISPPEFAQSTAPLLDCRSAQDFRLATLPGARLLDASAVAAVKGGPVRLFDQEGAMAGAAAVHLATLGCQPQVLAGGLVAWANQVDPTFPVCGSAPSRILPDWQQLRLHVPKVSLPLEGEPTALPFPCRRIWRSRDYLAVLRLPESDFSSLSRSVHQWLPQLDRHPWLPQARGDWAETLQKVLAEEIQPNLTSHKGVVELVEVRDGVARVRLGGGCQGCSSAAITVGQEIAAALYRAVPELEGVEDASDHQSAQAQPHH